MPASRPRHPSGFSLIEVLVALSVTLVALVLSMAFLAQQPRLLARLEAQQAADTLLEAACESLRAGQLELLSGEAAWIAAEPSTPLRDPALRLQVEDSGIADLFVVTLTASYTLEGRSRERSLHTRIWRP